MNLLTSGTSSQCQIIRICWLSWSMTPCFAAAPWLKAKRKMCCHDMTCWSGTDPVEDVSVRHTFSYWLCRSITRTSFWNSLSIMKWFLLDCLASMLNDASLCSYIQGWDAGFQTLCHAAVSALYKPRRRGWRTRRAMKPSSVCLHSSVSLSPGPQRKGRLPTTASLNVRTPSHQMVMRGNCR